MPMPRPRALEPADETRDLAPPREGLVRAVSNCEIRDNSVIPGPGTMHGYLAVFNEWSEINSAHEGHFMERLAPSAFTQTINSNRGVDGQTRMKVTFNHGKDPHLGDKVLGIPTVLEPDDHGVRYEVPLFDTEYNRELAPGLKAGAYGSSFRFNVVTDDFKRKPGASAYNPSGLPERTVKEVRMQEFGPVTFPAYPNATSGMRSMTDEFVFGKFLEDPGNLRRLVDFNVNGSQHSAPSRGIQSALGKGEPKQAATTKKAQPKPVSKLKPVLRSETTKMTNDERRNRIIELENWVRETDETYAEEGMPEEVRLEWDRNNAELDQHRADTRDIEDRRRRVQVINNTSTALRESEVDVPARTGGRSFEGFQQINRMSEAEVHDLNTVTRTNFQNPEQTQREFKDRAMRSLEFAHFANDYVDQAAEKEHVEKLIRNHDAPDPEHQGLPEIARRMLVTGSPQYRSGMNKYIAGKLLSPEEERAMSLGTTTAGGFAVVYELDPTFIRTSNLSVNPFRAICRQVTIAGTNEWRGVTSGGVTAAYGAEGSESTDNSPTLAQPACIVQKASAFVPVSLEALEDINGLQTELAQAFQDAKDDLEATEFTTGVGTTVHPQGILVGATTTTSTATTGAFVIGDLYALAQSLPPRFRARGVLVANRFAYDKVRAFDTAGGAGMWLGYPNPLQNGAYRNGGPEDGRLTVPLMGYPAYEDSAMVAALTTGSLLMVIGDFNYMVIVDRIGMNIEVAPMLFGSANRFPTGQRGVYAYWRNSSKVLSASAFRVLTT